MRTMAAVDRLRSFYGDQLLCRTGTLASIKSFGSAVRCVRLGLAGRTSRVNLLQGSGGRTWAPWSCGASGDHTFQ